MTFNSRDFFICVFFGIGVLGVWFAFQHDAWLCAFIGGVFIGSGFVNIHLGN